MFATQKSATYRWNIHAVNQKKCIQLETWLQRENLFTLFVSSGRAVRVESFHLQTPDAFPKINSFHFELHWLPFIFIDICFQRWAQTEYLCDQFQSIDSLNLHRKWNMMWKVTSSVHCSGCYAIHRYNYWMFYFQSIECVQCG